MNPKTSSDTFKTPDEQTHVTHSKHKSFKEADGDPTRKIIRDLANEVPISITFNGTSVAVMMATPNNLKDFAYGFALSECFISVLEDVDDFQLQHLETGIEARFWLKDAPSKKLDVRRRQMAGPIGCGLCGLDSIEAAIRDIPKLTPTPACFSKNLVATAMEKLAEQQPLHDQTNAMHAAGFLTENDGVVLAREDVGRHNALDKVIGAIHLQEIDPSMGAIAITSRLSVDLVQKTAILGSPMIIAASAPTATALEWAEQAGISLVGLARNGQFEIFTHPHRIIA